MEGWSCSFKAGLLRAVNPTTELITGNVTLPLYHPAAPCPPLPFPELSILLRCLCVAFSVAFHFSSLSVQCRFLAASLSFLSSVWLPSCCIQVLLRAVGWRDGDCLSLMLPLPLQYISSLRHCLTLQVSVGGAVATRGNLARDYSLEIVVSIPAKSTTWVLLTDPTAGQ